MNSFDRTFPRGSERRSQRAVAAAAMLAAGILSGCQSGYDMKVDALTRAHTSATAAATAESAVSYKIRSKNPNIDEDSLRFKEAKRYVETALSGKGMYEAPSADKADVVVELDYGVSEPRVKQETRSEPVYVMVPGRLVTQTVEVGTDSRGRPIYQTVTIQEPPTQEYIGDREYLVTVVNYEKHLRLSARENVAGTGDHPPQEIWTVDVSSEGESRDLRKYLPAMAAATMDYIGTDTRGQKEVRLQDKKDGAVEFVKKGM
jgi:hypothetical protein